MSSFLLVHSIIFSYIWRIMLSAITATVFNWIPLDWLRRCMHPRFQCRSDCVCVCVFRFIIKTFVGYFDDWKCFYMLLTRVHSAHKQCRKVKMHLIFRSTLQYHAKYVAIVSFADCLCRCVSVPAVVAAMDQHPRPHSRARQNRTPLAKPNVALSLLWS